MVWNFNNGGGVRLHPPNPLAFRTLTSCRISEWVHVEYVLLRIEVALRHHYVQSDDKLFCKYNLQIPSIIIVINTVFK